MAQNQKSIAWPLIFTYRGTILGNGFLAEISLQGRVLACPESEGVWVYGVNPGAIAISAPTLAATNVELRDTLTRLFIDFAEEAKTFDGLKTTIERFMEESDADSHEAWEAARREVREGRVMAPSDLRRETDDSVRYFAEVTEKPLNAVTPQDNLIVAQEVTRVYEMAA